MRTKVSTQMWKLEQSCMLDGYPPADIFVIQYQLLGYRTPILHYVCRPTSGGCGEQDVPGLLGSVWETPFLHLSNTNSLQHCGGVQP